MKLDVFILAAGEANRMFPLNQIMEKSLLPVNGKPVIRHIVENLTDIPETSIQLGNIFICCLKKFDKQFIHEFRDMPDIEFIGFDKPQGTFNTFIDAMRSTSLSQWVMVHYADCITDINYTEFLSKTDRNRDGVIAVTNNVKHDYSEVWLAKTGNAVLQFNEKPKIPSYTWSGIGLFHSNNCMQYYDRKNEGTDFAFDIFPQMIKKNKLGAYQYHGSWYDVGNLNSYRKVCEMFK
jgi:NDP-sugar pyrophosphorylase family protein